VAIKKFIVTDVQRWKFTCREKVRRGEQKSVINYGWQCETWKRLFLGVNLKIAWRGRVSEIYCDLFFNEFRKIWIIFYCLLILCLFQVEDKSITQEKLINSLFHLQSLQCCMKSTERKWVKREISSHLLLWWRPSTTLLYFFLKVVYVFVYFMAVMARVQTKLHVFFILLC
jgi:hypothetical protein